MTAVVNGDQVHWLGGAERTVPFPIQTTAGPRRVGIVEDVAQDGSSWALAGLFHVDFTDASGEAAEHIKASTLCGGIVLISWRRAEPPDEPIGARGSSSAEG
jgi:hypothetical protein